MTAYSNRDHSLELPTLAAYSNRASGPQPTITPTFNYHIIHGQLTLPPFSPSALQRQDARSRELFIS